MENTIAKINKYEQLIEGLNKIKQSKQELIDKVIPKKVKAKLADIDAEFDDIIENLNNQVKEIEDEIKQSVITNGESAKGTKVSFIYTKGRTTWDNKQMEVLLENLPEIAIARKVGAPYVSVKKG